MQVSSNRFTGLALAIKGLGLLPSLLRTRRSAITWSRERRCSACGREGFGANRRCGGSHPLPPLDVLGVRVPTHAVVVSGPADAAVAAFAAQALLKVVLEALGGGFPSVELRDDESSLLTAEGREVLEVAARREIRDVSLGSNVRVPDACLSDEGDRDLSVEQLSTIRIPPVPFDETRQGPLVVDPVDRFTICEQGVRSNV